LIAKLFSNRYTSAPSSDFFPILAGAPDALRPLFPADNSAENSHGKGARRHGKRREYREHHGKSERINAKGQKDAAHAKLGLNAGNPREADHENQISIENPMGIYIYL